MIAGINNISSVTFFAGPNDRSGSALPAGESLRRPSTEQQTSARAPSSDAVSQNTRASLVNQLSEQEQRLLRELVARDREVRAHEQAHANVGGRYAGSPSYTFQRGPDGRQYAVGGEVAIDVSPIPGDPQATIEKAQVVRRAALAPAEPSAQDRAVAAEATAIEQQARAELLAANNEGTLSNTAVQQGANNNLTEGLDALSLNASPNLSSALGFDALDYQSVDVRI